MKLHKPRPRKRRAAPSDERKPRQPEGPIEDLTVAGEHAEGVKGGETKKGIIQNFRV